MTTHHLHLPRSLAVATATIALAAPSAMARLSSEEAQVLASRGIGAPTPVTHVSAPRAASPDTGFDWGSAGIGAGAAAGLLLVAAGGVGATYRVRVGRFS
jgi:hypothetical protein